MKARYLGIAGKVYLSALLVLLLSFILIAGSCWIIAGNQARLQAESRIDATLHGVQTDLEQESKDLETLGNWLVDQPALSQMVRERDGQALTRYLQPWMQASIVDSLTVADSNGQVLTRVRVDQPTSSGDNIIDSAGVADALGGEQASGVEQDKYGRLMSRIILPIYANRQSAPAGVLILGFLLDGNFMQHVTLEGSQGIAIVYQDRVFTSSLADVRGRTIAGGTAPADVLAAERAGQASGDVLFPTDRDEYLFHFSPLQSPARKTVGMIGVGVSTGVILAQQTAFFEAFALALLGSLAGVILISFVFTRTLIRPIRILQGAAERMTRGDLSSPVVIKSRDELGTLAVQMESMRQQLRQALETATIEKSRYEAVIESMGVAAVITDKEQRVAGVNPAAERLLRETRTGLVGHPWGELFQDGGASAAMTAAGDGSDAGPVTASARLRLAARPAIVLDVISAPVLIGGVAAGSVHILQDASSQERLLQAKDEFMLNVAHELRGPLASLRSFIELLNEDYGSLPRRDSRLMLQALQRAIVRFQRLVENLIDIGSIQAGQFRVRAVPSTLRSLIDDAVSQVEPILRGSEQRLQAGPIPSPCMVLADPPRVTQVIVNLLSNASKYSPEGQEITLSACEEGNWVRVEVTDHGAGIPESEQREIFARFYRTKRAQEEGIGIGLGLALARAIVEGHGGRIGVRSQVGAGSTFWFTLPLVSDD